MCDGHADAVEYSNWKDTGCDLWPSCLTCPLPSCVEEEPRGRQRMRLDARAEVMRAMARQGSPVAEIAAAFHVSRRTVQRAFNRNNGHRIINSTMQESKSNQQ